MLTNGNLLTYFTAAYQINESTRRKTHKRQEC